MRVHYLQHVPFEGVGAIGEWARSRAYVLTSTEMFQRQGLDRSPVAARPAPQLEAPPVALNAPDPPSLVFPESEDLDFLIVMGGPMNVYQEAQHPWLPAEKGFIASMIAAGKLVLGVCLGAQLVADALGGPVSRDDHPEIGWYPVYLTEAGRAVPVFAEFPAGFTALHWHGDTFAVPPGAVHVASSEACANQAFAYDGGRVVGLQFHLEETPDSLALLIENARADLMEGRWIATPAELLAPTAPFGLCRELLFRLLDAMVSTRD
jgi:GMP synthase (glutamine-hydrolysing)